MSDTITLKCKECGNTVERKKHCAYTGIEHGRGWVYICECRGEMEVIDITPDSPYLCDILLDLPVEELVPWKVFKKVDHPECFEPLWWGVSVLEQIKDANKSIDDLFFDAMTDAGKRLDIEEVPTKDRTLKMWTFEDQE
jgi:hypothetical protein